MTDRELMQQALDALEAMRSYAAAEKKGLRICDESIEALRAALVNEFNPDWDQVEALQESLREHMAEIQRLRTALEQPEQHRSGYWCHDLTCMECYSADFRFKHSAPPKTNQCGETCERAKLCAVCAKELAQPEPEPWKCGCGANLYIDENGKPRSKAQGKKDVPEVSFGNMEPVAWIDTSCHPKHLRYLQSASERKLYGELQPLYTAPPQREWVGLTDEEISELYWQNGASKFVRAIEAKLKEKNT